MSCDVGEATKSLENEQRMNYAYLFISSLRTDARDVWKFYTYGLVAFTFAK